MKRLIFLILTLPVICYAGTLQNIRSVLNMYNAAASGAAVVFDDSDGFESPWAPTTNAGNWDSFTGAPTSEGIIVKKGSISMLANANGEYMNKDHADYTEIWCDLWFRAAAFTNSIYDTREIDSGGSNFIGLRIGSDASIQISDGTTYWNSTITASVDTWYHVFYHIIYSAAGSETVEIAVNTVDAFDSWDYQTSAATIVPINASAIRYGSVYQAGTVVHYLDTLRLYQGPGMPSSW